MCLCLFKECSKKTKTDDQENASVDVPSPAQENGEKGEFHKLADAKIFLSDCLACDSCVSAEEGIQVSQQNAKDFFQVLNLNKKCDTSEHKVLAVSLCPQSLPYFAAKFSLSVTDASRRLCGFLKSLGVHYVFDTTIAADFSILESQKEFVRRFRQHNEEEPALPMLTSACPGWVRYAERVLGHPVTPHLCTAKSPSRSWDPGEGLLCQTSEPVPRQDFPCHRGTVLRQEAGGPSGRRPHSLSGFPGH